MTIYVTKVRGLNPADGLIGGAIAGAVQTLVAMLYGLFGNTSWWRFPALLATLVGRPETAGGFSADGLIGIVVNIVLLSALGLLFALLARTLDQKALIWAGLAFGLVAWAIGYFVVLPAWSPALRNGIGMLTLASSMLVYGSVLGSYLSRRQKRELVSRG